MSDAGHVGTLVGDFSVDAHGDASYAISIETPPGTAGLMPRLAIAYNSGGANDVPGMGWSLRGLSMITRSPRTMAQDGVRGAVTYGPDDRFSLDGQRLVPVSGSYGEPGAVYRTEIESFTRVVPVYYGHDGDTHAPVAGRSGPDAFVVHTKDGKRHEYGTSPDAQIVASETNPAIRVWALNKVSDLFGNSLTVGYERDPVTNAFYPMQIAYTANEAAGLAPQRSVQFEYEPRPAGADAVMRYVGGYGVATSRRLHAIATHVAGAPVLRYTMQYETGDVTGRSRLISIVKSDGAGVGLSATTFSWQDGEPSLLAADAAVAVQGAANIPWLGTMLPMDVDGDGRLDLVNVSAVDGNLQLTLLMSNGAGFDAPRIVSTQIPFGTQSTVLPLDVDGDGRMDLVVVDDVDGDAAITVLTAASDAGGWTFSPGPLNAAGPPGIPSGGRFVAMDVDGDGLVDLVYAHPSQDSDELMLTTLFSNGESFAPSDAAATMTSWPFTTDAQLVPLDFDGDGMTDLVYATQAGDQTALNVLRSAGRDGFRAGPDMSAIGSIPWGGALMALDVNGDGLVDLVHAYSEAGAEIVLRTAISNGAGFEPIVEQQFAVGGVSMPIVLPMNLTASGLPDLVVCAQKDDNDFELSLSVLSGTGAGFARSASAVTQPGAMVPWGAALLPMDFDGDGRTDLVCAFGSDSDVPLLTLRAMQPAGAFPDLMTGIRNGLAGTIEIAYAPLTDAAVYTRAPVADSTHVDACGLVGSRVSGASYALVAGGPASATSGFVPATRYVDFPTYVLSGYVKGDGRGAAYSYGHRYAAARIDLTGRGWLGFQTTQAIDHNVGTTSETTYNQLFPWTHTPAAAKVWRTADEALMHTRSWTYEPPAPPPGAITAPAVATPVAIHPVRRESEVYTFGTLDFSQTASLAYDAFGNVVATAESCTDPSSPPRWITDTFHNEPDAWRLGYMTETKVTADAAGTEILSWARITYDPTTCAVTSHSAWAGQWQTTTFAYDPYGNKISTTDASGATTTTAYDDTHHTFVASVTSPEQAQGRLLVSTFEFDAAFGVRLKATDPNGVTTSQALDGLGRVISITGPDPDGSDVELERRSWSSDDRGIYEETSKRSDWGGTSWRWTRNYVDGLGRSHGAASLGPDGATPLLVDCTLDSRGQPTARSLPHYEGQTAESLSYEYDACGRPLSIARPRAGDDAPEVVTSYAYPTCLRVIQTEAAGTALARTTTTDYGLYGRQRKLVRSQDATGAVATYAYDALGRLLSAADPAATHSFTYDALGRVVSTSVASPTTTIYAETVTYDDLQRTVAQLDSAKNTVVWSHDALGRPTSKKVNAEQPTEYRYDDGAHSHAQGRCSAVLLPDGSSYGYGYDPSGAQSEITLTLDGDAYPLTKAFGPQGELERLLYPDGTVVSNEYNAAGSLVGVVGGAGAADATVIAYSEYDAFGKPRVASYANGTSESYGFDAIGRPTSMAASGPSAQQLMHQELEWNGLDQLTTLTDALTPASSESYTFDAVGRLRTATGPYGTVDHAYDGAGNLTRKGPLMFSVDGYRVTAATTGGAEVLSASYDGAGSMSSITRDATTTTYGFDGERRLVAAGKTTFAYDHEGRRLSKRDPDGTTTYYVAPYYEVVESPTGATAHKRHIRGAAGTVAATVTVHGGEAPAGDGASREGTWYLHRNHLGSVVAISDAAGQRISSLSYLPFGELHDLDGDDVTPRKFTGKELDGETGLYYLDARYYDPVLGRFITVDDRINAGPGRLDGLNVYAYAFNDPTSHVDPTGHSFWSTLAHGIGHVADAVVSELSHAVHGAASFFSNHVVKFFAQHYQEIVTFAVDAALVVAGGALIAATPFAGSAALGEMLLGAGVGGFAYNITTLATHGHFSWRDWGVSVGLGAVSGLAFAGTGAAVDVAAGAIANSVKVLGTAAARLGVRFALGRATDAVVNVGMGFAQNVITAAEHHSWTSRNLRSGLGWSALMGVATGALSDVAAAGLATTATRKLTQAEVARDRQADDLMLEVMARRFPDHDVELAAPTQENLLAPRFASPFWESIVLEVTPKAALSYAAYSALVAVPGAPRW